MATKSRGHLSWCPLYFFVNRKPDVGFWPEAEMPNCQTNV
jgi:hypothetical protein